MQNTLLRKGLVIGIILLFVGTSGISAFNFNAMKVSKPINRSNWLYVGGSGPGNYTTIQSAISASSNGNTIFVYDDSSPYYGSYYNPIIIDKCIKLIGENRQTTIIDGGGWGDVIKITVDDVNLSNFTIQNSGDLYDDSGVVVSGNYIIIFDNIIMDITYRSIEVLGHNCIVYNNIVKNPKKYPNTGIAIESSDNIVNNNNVTGFQFNILILYGNYNVITSNTCRDAMSGGIQITWSSHNLIENNNILNDDNGIVFSHSNNNTISYCTISYNSADGVCFDYSENNTISYCYMDTNYYSSIYFAFSKLNKILNNNLINNPYNGIWIYRNNNNNIISNCHIINNNQYGIFVQETNNNNNVIHHNTFSNNYLENAYDVATNQWDDGLEGNFWDDYNGEDTNGDGIGDIPYSIPGGNNQDHYPLIEMQEMLIDVFTDRPNNPRYYIGEEIQVRASCSYDNEPLLGAEVHGNITNDGQLCDFTLFDDGQLTHGDFFKDDGIYSARLASPEVGFPTGETRTYKIEVDARSGDLDGEGSTQVQYGGWPGSRLTVNASVEDLTPPFNEYYKNDTIAINAQVKNTQGLPYDKATVKAILHLPDNSQQELTPNKTEQPGEYTIEYEIPKEGPYLIDLSATSDVAHGDYYSPGYTSMSLYVYRGLLTLFILEPGNQCNNNSLTAIRVNATCQNENIDGLTVSAFAVDSNGKYRTQKVTLLPQGNGEYQGEFIPEAAILYYIHVEASGAYFKKTEVSKYINVLPATVDLVSYLGHFIDAETERISTLSNNIKGYANDGDYFKAKLNRDLVRLGVDVFFDLLSVTDTGASYLGRQGVIHWLHSYIPGINHLVKNKDALKPLGDTMSTTLLRALENGQISEDFIKKYYEDSLRYFIFDFLENGFDETSSELIKDTFTSTIWDDGLNTRFYSKLNTYALTCNNGIDQIGMYISQNLPEMTPERQIQLMRDLSLRDQANGVLNTQYYSMGDILRHMHIYRENQENDMTQKIFEIVVWYGAQMIVFYFADGLGLLALQIIKTEIDFSNNWKNLNEDTKFMSMAMPLMEWGDHLITKIYFNTFWGISQCAEDSSVEYPKGEILYSNDYASGQYKDWCYPYPQRKWFEKEAYSQIGIKNTGEIPAIYKLGAVVTTKDNYDVWYDMIPDQENPMGYNFSSNTGREVKIQYNSLSDDIRGIQFYLFAETNDGIYLVDQSDYHSFNPTRIENTQGKLSLPSFSRNDNISSINITSSYPIQTQISTPANNFTYIDHIMIENPFPYPITVNLTQHLPNTVQCLSSYEGQINNDSIIWSEILQPYEKKIVNYTILPLLQSGDNLSLDGATMDFYNPQSNQTLNFTSNEIIFTVKPSFIADAFIDPRIYSYEENLLHCHVINLKNTSVNVTVNVSMFDMNGSTNFCMEEKHNIRGSKSSEFNISFIPAVIGDIYGLRVTVANSTSKVGALSTLINVFNFKHYPIKGSKKVERPPDKLNVSVKNPNGGTMDVYIRWKNHIETWITLATYNGVSNGTYTFLPTGNDWIWGNTTYTWSVNVTDGSSWTNETYAYTTGGSRYDVNNNNLVNFQDAGLVWTHRTSLVPYDGLYDVNQDGNVNFQDAGLTWIHRD